MATIIQPGTPRPSSTPDSPSSALRALLDAEGPLVAPGAANALTARVIADVGFETVYVTGAGVANTFLGTPDIGLVTLTELTAHVAAIAEAVDLPLIVDADTGFGNPLGVRRTVRQLEAAGAAAIQLEDQVSPKRCGHFEGTTVIATREMVAKVQAAKEASRHDIIVVARTDALATEGFEAAVERAAAYAEAGADLTFVEGPRTRDDLLALPERLPVPQVANMVQGGRTPLVPVTDLSGFGVVLFANIALQAAVRGMQQVLGRLRDHGSLDGIEPLIADWTERQRLVGKPDWDALDDRYAAPTEPPAERTS